MSETKRDPQQPPLKPSRGHSGVDAGYDLFLDNNVEIQGGTTSGWISMARPMGCDNVLYFLRSSAQKKGLSIVAVCERHECDFVSVKLANFGRETWRGERGERVVQALFLPLPTDEWRYYMAVPRDEGRGFPHVLDGHQVGYDHDARSGVNLTHVDTSLHCPAGGLMLKSEFEGSKTDGMTEEPKWLPMCCPDAELLLTPGETFLFDLRCRARLQANQALLLTPGARCREAGVNVQGVVDPGYSGPIMAIATNTGRDAVVVNRDFYVDLTVVRVISAMDDVGTRGEGGFGSSGR